MRRQLICLWILYGSLLYAQPPVATPSKPTAPATIRKNAAATRAFKIDFSDATLWLDWLKWYDEKRVPGRVAFTHVDRHVLGYVLVDRTAGVPTSKMSDWALRNAMRLDPKARIRKQEYRLVNGRELLHLELVVSQNSPPMVFAGYYHGGVKTNLQAISWCFEEDFEKHQSLIDEFISGIEIREESAKN
jgi:hypothetical protein